jgi:hypothetical protein
LHLFKFSCIYPNPPPINGENSWALFLSKFIE